MSVYVVKDQTISNIVHFLNRLENETQFVTEPITGKYHISDDNSRQQFGQILRDMNVDSVNFHYNESEKYPDFTLSAVGTFDRFQVYKNIQFFLYQCMGGDIPKSELYSDMSKLSDRLAHNIVMNSTLYDNAEW